MTAMTAAPAAAVTRRRRAPLNGNMRSSFGLGFTLPPSDVRQNKPFATIDTRPLVSLLRPLSIDGEEKSACEVVLDRIEGGLVSARVIDLPNTQQRRSVGDV